MAVVCNRTMSKGADGNAFAVYCDAFVFDALYMIQIDEIAFVALVKIMRQLLYQIRKPILSGVVSTGGVRCDIASVAGKIQHIRQGKIDRLSAHRLKGKHFR